MPNYVEGVGPLTARLAIFGEAPGKVEDYVGKPFVGAAGNLLSDWLRSVGIDRREVRIDNLCPFLPPGEKIENLSGAELAYWARDMRLRVAQLPNVNVVVTTGNYATFALVGKGKVKKAFREALGEDITATEAERKAGITKLRGSTYYLRTLAGRSIKVISVIHPAWFLHAGGLNMRKQRRALADFRRIARETATNKGSPMRRTHIVDPLEQDVAYVCDNLPQMISVDVETPKRRLTCVGFGLSPIESIVIPTATDKQRKVFLPYIKKICESSVEKALHFGTYDWYWLDTFGINIENYWWETGGMHHALEATDSHSLDYIASIYCNDYRYWKDEAKDAEEIQKFVRSIEALWEYNGLDVCYTYELVAYLYGELVQKGLLDFYFDHYQTMLKPLIRTMRYGVRVDVAAQKEWHVNLMAECDKIRYDLADLAGEDLYAKKDFSLKKLRKYFYETLGLPKKYKLTKTQEGKKQSITLDAAALRKLARLPKGQKAARLLLSHREKAKRATFLAGAWDDDERVRCWLKFTTEQGRLAASRNPTGTGLNLHNQDRRIRGTFLPDEGCVFVKADLSQVEDRICKMWTQTPRMVELANLRPDEYDAHRANAADIFGVSAEDVTKEQRYFGKRVVHAAERGISGMRLSDELIKEEVYKSPKECQKLIDRFLEKNWEIRYIYFPTIREVVRRDRKLVNSWGRVWKCEYDRFDADLYRRAYSFILQSDAADLLNQWGYKLLMRWIDDNRMRSRINLQEHDELIISCPPQEAWPVVRFLVASLERPLDYFGNALIVPTCVTVAATWADDEFEFKRLPTEAVFDDAVTAVWDRVNKGEGEEV